jgi:hypothetical protein
MKAAKSACHFLVAAINLLPMLFKASLEDMFTPVPKFQWLALS